MGAGIVLTITKLRGAEYLISSVADGLEDYYMGAGEAPGVWRGRWAESLGLEGVVGAAELRALVDGLDPRSGEDLLAGLRERKVRAIDVTLSVPKSVSLLWAFGTPATAAAVSIAVVEATDEAVTFLEERAAVARQQSGGVRRRVATGGFAVATFAHRTSRDGDPQLHTHCLIPNVVQRADGRHVAIDAAPLHVWGKAAGTVFLNTLERHLTQRLGVDWGPERNGSRELVGFTREQLRAFSKRTVAIETRLEANGEVAFSSKAERMRADDRASVATRARKDKTLTPERLRDRWATEAKAAGLEPGRRVDALVVGRQVAARPGPTPGREREWPRERERELGEAELFAALVDSHTGLCATDSRFGEAHVVERVAAMSAGRLTTGEIVEVARRFLGTDLVVRLMHDEARRRPSEWSTVELRGVEDRLLDRLNVLAARPVGAVPMREVRAAIALETKSLGDDQVEAVRVLCGAGSSVRLLVAPAGYGKTTAVHAAATAARAAGRPIVALAPTHKAVAELRAAGLEAHTIARFRTRLEHEPLAAGAVVIVDEMSQVATRDAAVIAEAVAATDGAQVWWVGDARQAQAVAAAGLASHLEHLADAGVIPAARLTVNRRQHDPAERQALAQYRAGDVDASHQVRTDHGWEHQAATPADTRQGLACAATADADRHGVEHVAVLAVSHADCEDLADRIRAIRAARGELRGPTLTGPAWGPEARTYAAGDRVLVHANPHHQGERRVHNGSTGTVLAIGASGMSVLVDGEARTVVLHAAFVAGRRHDGTPNMSHAWARTVDGAQGGTWRQVHLLGTPALDRFTGYVGQSRGRHPTHTWNTRPDAEHPLSLLADDRQPAEAVLDAMRRHQPKRMAALDDPWILDRALRAEVREHAAVIAERPPDHRHDLDRVRHAAASAEREHTEAQDGLARAQRMLDGLGPLTRLRRGGRDEIARAEQAHQRAERRLGDAADALEKVRIGVAHFETAVSARDRWDRQHAWRVERVAEIDDTLAHHWADVTLRAVRADDPLAFGVERLRHARHTYRDDLQHINASLPPDRTDHLARAEADLRHHQANLDHHQRTVQRAQGDLDQAHQRRWGRRDQPAIDRAEAALTLADAAMQRTAENVAQDKARVERERAAVCAYQAAIEDTAADRGRIRSALADIDHALDDTRPQRVRAAGADPTSALSTVIGPRPEHPAGRATWSAIAERIETWRDHTPPGDRQTTAGNETRQIDQLLGPRPRYGEAREWDRLANLVDRSEQLIAHAVENDRVLSPLALDEPARWQAILELIEQAARIEAPQRHVEHGHGIEL